MLDLFSKEDGRDEGEMKDFAVEEISKVVGLMPQAFSAM